MIFCQEAVSGEVPARNPVCLRRSLDGDNPSGPASAGIDGKGPGVGEAIQNGRSPAESADHLPVPALIEEKSRLLSGEQIDLKAQSVLQDRHHRWDFSRHQADPFGQPLLRTGASPAPLVNTGRFENFGQQIRQGSSPLLHPRRSDRINKIPAIAIADMTGHPVALGIDQPIGVRSRRNDLLPKGDGACDAPPPKTAVDFRCGIFGQQAKSDVAPVVETEAEGFSPGIDRKDHLPGHGLPFHPRQRPGKDPGVPAAERRLATFPENDPRMAHDLLP